MPFFARKNFRLFSRNRVIVDSDLKLFGNKIYDNKFSATIARMDSATTK